MQKQLNVSILQQQLRESIAKNCKNSPIEAIIRFPNNDVMIYLERLDTFEANSQKAHIVVV